MSAWDDLTRELDAWQSAGRTAAFWWRDDDATTVTRALERLLALATTSRTPIALAVIPRDASEDLRQRLRPVAHATVLQHGFAHENHAPDDARQEEYGPDRPREAMIAEMAEGWRRTATFDRACPVMVAPWNRMDEALLPDLPQAGLSGVSTLGPRPAADAAPGVRRVNVHVDIVDWGGTRGFVGLDNAIRQIVVHLEQRRHGISDADEPTGLMTHHLFHDDGCWWFIGELLHHTAAHPAAGWLSARQAFWP